MPSPYGDGSDGDKTVSSNWTMDRDYQWQNLTVNGGVTLNTAGYVIRVKNTLINNGIITDNNNGGAGGSGGSGGAGHVGDGNGNPGSNGSSGGSGSGGAGNGGAGGGGGGGGAGQSAVVSTTGGNGGSGGNGGKGGGVVTIYAKIFTNNGTVHADGFSGSTGSNGGDGELDGWIIDPMSEIFADLASGGGGGAGGGNGGNGGTVNITYQSRTIGTVRTNGGSGGGAGSGGSGKDCGWPQPGGTEYSGGSGGSGGGSGGSGGTGEEGTGVSGNGSNGNSGNNGSAGTVNWTQQSAYDDSGIRYYKDSVIAVACEELTASHKLRFRKGSTTVGLPLVPTTDGDASPWRIHDGSGIKALVKYT